MTVKCIKCDQSKPIGDFAKGRINKAQTQGTCKVCHSAYMVTYYHKNDDQREHKNRLNSKHRPAWKRHRISKEYFDELMSKYDDKCHICKINEANCVDHDHNCCPRTSTRGSCGKCVRGLLCNQCNTSLGNVKENVQTLLSMVEYVNSYSGVI